MMFNSLTLRYISRSYCAEDSPGVVRVRSYVTERTNTLLGGASVSIGYVEHVFMCWFTWLELYQNLFQKVIGMAKREAEGLFLQAGSLLLVVMLFSC